MGRFLKNILWATDFSKEAEAALAYAEVFAKAFSAQITAVHVAPDFSPALYDTSLTVEQELIMRMDAVKKDAKAKLRRLGKKAGRPFKKIIMTEGSAPKKIIETAENEKSDLIVIGKKGQSILEKILIGSVANHVLRHSPVPVLVTKKRQKKFSVGKILVPTDFTKEEEMEREFAWRLAKGFGASLTLLYVLELYGHEFRFVDQMFDSVLDKFKKKVRPGKRGIKVSHDVTRAINAALGIEDYSRANQYDLIVMATCVGGLGRFFLGSTTEKVISYTDLPVFALPPKYCS
jgi:nucleotide-binding universal stress UspA family protein